MLPLVHFFVMPFILQLRNLSQLLFFKESVDPHLWINLKPRKFWWPLFWSGGSCSHSSARASRAATVPTVLPVLPCCGLVFKCHLPSSFHWGFPRPACVIPLSTLPGFWGPFGHVDPVFSQKIYSCEQRRESIFILLISSSWYEF